METNNHYSTFDFNINVDSSKLAIINTLKMVLMKLDLKDANRMVESFSKKYENLLSQHNNEDKTDLSRYYRLITTFKPALAMILKPGELYDEICDIVVKQFNIVLNRIRNQIKEKKERKLPKGPILPGSNKTIDLKYLCTVCEEEFEIPSDIKTKLLNSSEKMELPKHHDKEMVIRIKKPEKIETTQKIENKIEIYPAELLMGHLDSHESNAEYLKILSVGIDVGSSTSHLIFSRLTLRRERSFFNMSNRFYLVNREIIYKGNIIFTPLVDRFTIDIEMIIEFFKKEYQQAGITPEMVDTGAVIVTGETAKKQNAEEIVKRLSSESGKFVSASAGPNFESLLGAMGSGAVDLSRQMENTIINVDVGGGTSNLAIASKGTVISTSCINVGGRLLGIDENFKIWRIDEPTELVLEYLNINYKLGDVIPEQDVRAIAREYAKALMEVIRGPASSKIARKLMMTEDIDFTIPIDQITFSGGIAELIYSNESDLYEDKGKIYQPYNDIGVYLAEEIVSIVNQLNLPLMEPENKIRATVIGAGAFSLSISGSTCYYDENIKLPIENVPVVPVNINLMDSFKEKKNVKAEIEISLKNFNIEEGKDLFALYFKDLLNPRNLPHIAKEIEEALPISIANNQLILIILGFDGGKMLGVTLKRETSIKSNIFCLDELDLAAGDWIDIGAPLKGAFPVTIKSLVFNKSNSKVY